MRGVNSIALVNPAAIARQRGALVCLRSLSDDGGPASIALWLLIEFA